MGVRPYSLLQDVCTKIYCETETEVEIDDLFLFAEIHNESDYPTNQAALHYAEYCARGVIPDWMEDWLIDVMVGTAKLPILIHKKGSR